METRLYKAEPMRQLTNTKYYAQLEKPLYMIQPLRIIRYWSACPGSVHAQKVLNHF